MMRAASALLLAAGSVLAGCMSTSERVADARMRYLDDPSMPRHGYDGEVLNGDAPYRFLLENDPKFGEFLLTIVPTASDVRVAKAALIFYAWKSPDRAKFDEVVKRLNPILLSVEVDLSGTDLILMMPLYDWIAQTRKNKNWDKS
jgi:hypothetical protein